MTRRCAEAEATVMLSGEVAAEAAFAVEANLPATVWALAYPVPEVGWVHAFNVGAAAYAWADPS